MQTWHMAPMGEAALLVEHASSDMATANAAVGVLARRIQQQVTQTQLPGIQSITPAIQSVLIRFDPVQCSRQAMEVLVRQCAAVDEAVHSVDMPAEAIVRIEVRYGGEVGPDLMDVAQHTGLTPQAIIDLHTAQPWRVLMMGFAPGFAYLGPLPSALNVPRRRTPRPAVPMGSVAIAAGMTGIYPARLPGGWHIIGRTRETLFDPAQQPPTRITPGGWVQFVQAPESE